MSSSLQHEYNPVVQKIACLLEQDLMYHILNVDGTACVIEPEIGKKINKWKSNVEEVLLKTVCALDENLYHNIKSVRGKTLSAGDDITLRMETPLGNLFRSTLIEQAMKISSSVSSRYLQLPILEKHAFQDSSDKEVSNSLFVLKNDINRRKDFYGKKLKVLFIGMEDDLKKVFSGVKGEDEKLLRKERKLDLTLNSIKHLGSIIAEVKQNDIVEEFWKLFVGKYFSGKVSPRNAKSSTQLDNESDVSRYIDAYGHWKHMVDSYLTTDFHAFVGEFINIISGNETKEKVTYSSPALIAIEHFKELRRKIEEESSRPVKEIEFECTQIMELIDSGEQRVFVKVLKENLLEICKSFMRSQRDFVIKYVNKLEMSVLKKGFTIEDMRKMQQP